MKNSILFSAFSLMSLCLFAQITPVQPSPSAKLTQTVGLTEVNVEYSRPAKRDREIFGELVPYNELWRTGANSNTVVSFSDSITLGNQKLMAGDYALYTKPGKDQWEVIFYSNTGNWGTPDDWDDGLVAASLMVKPVEVSNSWENFTIAINNLKTDGASLDLMWDKTMVSVPFNVPTDEKMLASINRIISGPTAADYFSAASFYMETGKDIKQAKQWVDMAVAKSPDAYWMWRSKSLIEAKMGDKKAAIESAKKSMALAAAAPNPDYVRLNKISLEEWGVKM